MLPKFKVFFASLNAQLPISTRILMGVTSFISNNQLTIIATMLLIALALFLYRRTERGQRAFDVFTLKAPILGTIFTTVILERFSRVLSSLLKAGVPLPDSLDLTANAVSNRVYTKAISEVTEGVLRGEGLSDPLERTETFPEETVQIIRVGEQSGQLTTQLEHAANYYAKEVDYKLKNLTTLLEPIVLIIVGGGVGFVAIALVSAMYGIYSSSSLNG